MLVSDVTSMPLDSVFADYRRDGYARLGRVLSQKGAETLCRRADEIMLGQVSYEGLFFQHDSATGRYDDLHLGEGYRGPSRDYRKIEKLEVDPLFYAWINNPLFGRIARQWIQAQDGEQDVVIYRAVLFTKGPAGGTDLPFHQDGGLFWGVDRPPTLQIWTALDDCPIESGCVEVLPGSHHKGLITPQGGVVAPNQLAKVDVSQTVALPAKQGEAILIHNHVFHRSGRNTTGLSRRGLTVCYMAASVRCLRKKRAPRVFRRVFETLDSGESKDSTP